MHGQRLALVLAALLLSGAGCAHEAKRPPAKSADATTCPVDHCPLVKTTAYTFSDDVTCALPGQDFLDFVIKHDMAREFPYETPFATSPTPSKLMRKPTRIVYCPRCDARLSAALARASHQPPQPHPGRP